jgi:hypothetical protein
MKRTVLVAITALIALASLPAMAQMRRNCGTGLKYQKLAVENPALLEQIRERQRKRTEEVLAFMNRTSAKSTDAQYPIPVAFHFILTPDQWAKSGNDTGIIRRVYSQLKKLNEDFNERNADSTLIPAAFKSLYTNAGIQFGLANTSNSNTISPGIEVKVLPLGTPAVYDFNEDCYTAKEATAIGLPAWDVTKYLNIWIVNVTSGGAGVVLGITTSPQSFGEMAGSHTIDSADFGIVLNYGAFGVREFPAQYFVDPFNLGRTLTHEMGHYFELYHTWGDDNGACPGQPGGQDDDISDTPPEANATYCDKPPGNACPTFPYYDACSPTFPGVMFMNYMDYVDDRAMQMFTTEQGARMRAYLLAESYSLTQNPQLLQSTGVAPVAENSFRIFPNPARDAIHIVSGGSGKLLSIDVVNMTGQRISHIAAGNADAYDVRLGDAAPGIYFVQCRFAEGTLTKKIVLE